MDNNPDKENKKDQMVDQISCNGKEILLIGTAHVSKQSAELVEKTIHGTKTRHCLC